MSNSKTPWIATCHVSLSFTVRVCSNSCSLSQWCHPTISSSVIPFPSRLQSFPASGSFQMSQFFPSGGQSIGASASVLPMNIQDWLPLGWTGWISLQFKGLLRVFSSTTVQKHHVDFKWKLTTIEKVINWECEGKNSSHTLPLPSYVAQGLLFL